MYGSPAQDLIPPCLLLGAPVLTRESIAAWLQTCDLPSAYQPLLAAADTPGRQTGIWGHFWPPASIRDRLALYVVVLRSRELTADPSRCQEILDAAYAWADAFEPLLSR